MNLPFRPKVHTCGFAIAMALVVTLVSGEADAESPKPLICRPHGGTTLSPEWFPLERDPLLLHHALPPERQCEFDEDGNGIDDEIERKIAQMVVPEFRFDSAENARRPDEPHVIWNASVIPSAMVDIPLERDAILIRFRFGFLWEKDGGFVVDRGSAAGTHTMVTPKASRLTFR